jgi:hypothetical protein
MMAAPPQQRPDRAQNTERDAKIYELRLRGLTERAIAAEVRLSPTRVHEILAAAYAARTEPLAEALRMQAADRLDDQRRTAHQVRARIHYVVQGGKIVKDDDGVPLVDDGPVLSANAQLLAIETRAARLFGLDSPEALTVSLAQRADVESDLVTRAIEAAAAALALTPERKTYMLEAAAAVLDGTDPPPMPEPDQEQQQAAAPWPVNVGDRSFVQIKGQWYEHTDTGPDAEQVIDLSDADVTESPETAEQPEGDATPSPQGQEAATDDPGDSAPVPGPVRPRTDAEVMAAWPPQLRHRALGRQIW